LDNTQLFQGHAKFRNVYAPCSQVSLRDSVLHHVSAHGLQSLLGPSSLKAHANLHHSDKAIWDDAYNEEYDGLVSLPSWEVVSEDEYLCLSRGKRPFQRWPLPQLSVMSTIDLNVQNII
jgi:hypothetical protein